MLAAFQDFGKGLEHCRRGPGCPDPGAAAPGGRAASPASRTSWRCSVKALKPIDMRYANDPAWILKGTGEKLNHNRVWMRTDGTLPADPLLHAADAGLFLRHHRARFDHHHARFVVGAGPNRRGDGEPFDLVPSPVPFRRVGSLRHRVAGRGGFARIGDGPVLFTHRRIDRHHRAGRRHPAFPGALSTAEGSRGRTAQRSSWSSSGATTSVR